MCVCAGCGVDLGRPAVEEVQGEQQEGSEKNEAAAQGQGRVDA